LILHQRRVVEGADQMALILEVFQQPLVVDVETQRTSSCVQIRPVDKQSHALVRVKTTKHGRCPRSMSVAPSHVGSRRRKYADGPRRPDAFPKFGLTAYWHNL